MKLHDLRPDQGATKKNKRVGRGPSAGQGKTAGRGTKGQNARSGGGVRPYFEGGQLPLVRKLPYLRGEKFFNPYKTEFEPVNLDELMKYFAAGAEVTPEALTEVGLIKHPTDYVAVLGRGDISQPLTVQVHRISKSAQVKIESAGGTVELMPWTRGGFRTR